VRPACPGDLTRDGADSAKTFRRVGKLNARCLAVDDSDRTKNEYRKKFQFATLH
jgi:hypothetical protein